MLPDKKTRHSRGLTLIETLVALALLGLVIGLVADTAREYAGIIVFQNEKDDSVQALEAVGRLTKELERSPQVIEPSGPTPTDEVQFKLVDSRSVDRRSTVDPWTPWRESDRLTVTYRLEGERLVREETKGALISKSVVAPKVSGFTCQRVGLDGFAIRISLEEKRRVHVFSQTAFRWLP